MLRHRATAKACARHSRFQKNGVRKNIASRWALASAVFAAVAVTGVSADTLAQPKDDALERAAANYIRFREDVAAIEAMAFDSAEVTREAHRRLGAHNAGEISSGWVAYAALVASDTPEFAASIKKEIKKRRRGKNPGGQAGLMMNLALDPSYARKLNGAETAIASVLAMTAQDAARVTALGEAFKSQAYAMQKTSWGKARVANGQKRLAEVDTFRRSRGAAEAPAFARPAKGGVVAPSLASANEFWAADWGEQTSASDMSESNAQAVIDRVLNLAARYSTDAMNSKLVEVYARNDKSNRCLSMAKLTLDQCIAATRTPYEEAFCLGEHALNDVASCVSWVNGASAS
ncbi:MAG: hypothetical protein AAGC77_03040 [Pseudomonadota bacterium]